MDWRRTTHHLDEQQMEFINQVIQLDAAKYWIAGVAGTGKSLVMLRLAERIRALPSNPTVIIATFTNALTKMFEFHANLQGIKVMNIRALERSNSTCDYLFLDEFQDVSQSTFDALLKIAKKGIFIGGDLDQQIYADLIRNDNQRPIDKQFTDNIEFLYRKFVRAYRISRTGVKVCEAILGKSFSDVEYVSDQDCKYRYSVTPIEKLHFKTINEFCIDRQETGSPVGVLFAKNDQIRDFLTNVSTTITITKSISSEAKSINLQLRELNSHYRVLGNDDTLVEEAGSRPLSILSTIHSAKGLDFDYVVVASLPKRLQPELTYVACSRGKRMTYIVSQQDIPLFETGAMRNLLTVVDDEF